MDKVLAAFYDPGIRVPDAVALVSFEGTAESAYLCPALTTVRQPLEQIAQASLRALLDDDPESDRAIDTELVIRQSCGCPGPRVAEA